MISSVEVRAYKFPFKKFILNFNYYEVLIHYLFKNGSLWLAFGCYKFGLHKNEVQKPQQALYAKNRYKNSLFHRRLTSWDRNKNRFHFCSDMIFYNWSIYSPGSRAALFMRFCL